MLELKNALNPDRP